MSIPLTYREVAGDITARIASGEYPPGSKLPSYAQLAGQYSVGATTIRMAVTVLRERAVVQGSPGRGVFVADRRG